ncbi:hypothetical protein BJ508DRAFT_331351 [Ascobolus immersus RN42]|uniref:F-box domain-containing protein n=1 Tax=Ascobolus immersus RN42 TaxID=1160509 RepID=A0A3N4HT41_ASCIM|nr:hypothetical protein BJ508DRAFT_331351 [Ascobolus immersus RN42]
MSESESNTVSTSQLHILSLPNEILHNIAISHPDPRGYLRLGQVNKHFRAVVTTPYTRSCFVKQWVSTYLRASTTPTIIEYIVRYVCFHHLPPFRCLTPLYTYPRIRPFPHHTLSPRNSKTPFAINRFVKARLGDYKGSPGLSGVRWKDRLSGAEADLGTLVRQYTGTSCRPSWFIEFYARLRNREAPAGGIGMEEVVLAFYMYERWQRKVRFQEMKLRAKNGAAYAKSGSRVDTKTGRNFYNIEWLWTRDKYPAECRCRPGESAMLLGPKLG